MKVRHRVSAVTVIVFATVMTVAVSGQRRSELKLSQAVQSNEQGDQGLNEDSIAAGRRLFERETFGGNGRTCLTCHSRKTGTVSPKDAQARFNANPHDPLFAHDGSDDGKGNGVTRMLADATILMTIPLPPNVRLGDSSDRFVVVKRGIPTTLNTPALDPVLMLDGRQPTLELQANGAIHDHAQATIEPTLPQLELIKQFQQTDASFFSSPVLKDAALGGSRPKLPRGNTASEKRGRRFFEDVPPNPADGFKPGLCAHCHSGTLMDQTNEFAPQFFGVPVKTGTRFQNVLVSFFNQANNPVREFIFNEGTPNEAHVFSPDPGRALITGVLDGPTTFENTDAFRISQLRGIRHTAPYFHDNSAKTLEDVAAHYAKFFDFVTGGFIVLTEQDQADIVAFLKLLD
jgi:Di-haem cytochrome c peroxidase